MVGIQLRTGPGRQNRPKSGFSTAQRVMKLYGWRTARTRSRGGADGGGYTGFGGNQKL
jgi:hypothetical protein